MDVMAGGPVKGDKVTLWSNGQIKGALGSSRFDSYGSPTGRILLIESNVLRNFVADQRYATYLGLPVTGEFGNVEVGPGTTPYEDLRSPQSDRETIYHLQAFSAFEPNPITGAFSAEIRAGYEISKSGIRPIKGGSVSGILQRDLLDCRLSKEQVLRENALVPKGVLFKKLTIAGA
jgi:PmbA protein